MEDLHLPQTSSVKMELLNDEIKSENIEENQELERTPEFIEYINHEDYSNTIKQEGYDGFIKQENYCYFLKQEDSVDYVIQEDFEEEGGDTLKYEDFHNIEDNFVMESEDNEDNQVEETHENGTADIEPPVHNNFSNSEEECIYISDSGSSNDSDRDNIIYTGDSRVLCAKCNKSFKHLRSASRHNCRKHVICHLCGKVLKRKLTLKNHLFKIHRICHTCGKFFSKKSVLKKHGCLYKSNTNAGSYKCTDCRATFRSKSLLRIHSSQQHKRYFKCEVCNKVLPNEESLQQHMNCHSPDTSYKCSTCCLTFETKKKLTVHETIHVSKPYKCCICSKCFISEDNLFLHSLIHDYQKVSVTECKICKLNYYKPSDYVKHCSRYHKNM